MGAPDIARDNAAERRREPASAEQSAVKRGRKPLADRLQVRHARPLMGTTSDWRDAIPFRLGTVRMAATLTRPARGTPFVSVEQGLPEFNIDRAELCTALLIAAMRDVPELFSKRCHRESAFREAGPPRFMQHQSRSKS
jgi:hypothetical protein